MSIQMTSLREWITTTITIIITTQPMKTDPTTKNTAMDMAPYIPKILQKS